MLLFFGVHAYTHTYLILFHHTVLILLRLSSLTTYFILFSAAFQLITSQMFLKYSAFRFSYCR